MLSHFMIDLQMSLTCFLKLTMMSATCPECDMEFSRKDALLRHKRNRHGITQSYPQNSDAFPPNSQIYPPPKPPPQVVLQHPITLMAIGPTFSGKSCWMNRYWFVPKPWSTHYQNASYGVARDGNLCSVKCKVRPKTYYLCNVYQKIWMMTRLLTLDIPV
jgi:hypothetical protein